MAPESGTNLRFSDDGLYRLGLTRQPFAEPPQAPFEDTAHATQLNVTLSLLQSGERIVLISGGEGVGKSTFLARLAQLQPPGLNTRLLRPEELHRPEILWGALVAAAEGEEAPIQDARREDALHHVRSARRSGLRPCLLIDDAHTLQRAVAEEIMGLWQELEENEEAFSLALAADPAHSLPWNGSGAGVPSGRIHTATLFPLTEDRAAAYLEHRLQDAGADPGLLTDADKAAIFQAAGGYPVHLHAEAYRLLSNRLAQRADTAAPLHSGLLRKLRRRPSPRAVGAAAAVGGILLSGGALLWIASGLLTSPALDSGDDELAIEDLEPDDGPAAVEADTDGEDAGEAGAEAEDEGSGEERMAAQQFAPDEGAEPVAAEGDPADDGPVADEAPEPGALEDADLAEDEAIEWVAEQGAERFTIQLLAASDPEMLADYRDDHGLPEPTHVTPTRREGEPWFLLLHGTHADRESAREELETLPEELREHGAWVRTFESVQDELERELAGE